MKKPKEMSTKQLDELIQKYVRLYPNNKDVFKDYKIIRRTPDDPYWANKV